MIGIDLVKIQRIEKFVARFGEKGLHKFLTQTEIEISKNNIKRIAGFWAVKEAISKALGVGISKSFSFHDVEISKNKNGSPIANISEKIKANFNIKNLAISITHDGDYAIAVATIQIN